MGNGSSDKQNGEPPRVPGHSHSGTSGWPFPDTSVRSLSHTQHTQVHRGVQAKGSGGDPVSKRRQSKTLLQILWWRDIGSDRKLPWLVLYQHEEVDARNLSHMTTCFDHC